MAKIDVYNLSGAKVSTVELNDAIFGIEPHKQSMFDAIIMQRAALRQGTHKTKGRGEVRGGGRKPWRQKGTGRARQGSIRAPQWRGGGTVFGPTPRSYAMKMNKKAYHLALKSMYASKMQQGNIIIIDSTELDTPKTKTMVNAFNALNVTKPLVITDGDNFNLSLSVRNIPKAKTMISSSVSVLDLAQAESVLISVDAIKRIEEVLAK
jgi:large subunit ribosomal protein L4